jgi:hypothetical protein
MHSYQTPEGLVRLRAVANNALGGVECPAVEETVVVQEGNLGGMVIVLAKESLKVPEYSMRARRRRFEAKELQSVQLSKYEVRK